MIGVPLHALFVLLGTATAVVVFFAGAGRRQVLGPDLLAIMVGALFCGALGAKLAVLWRYLDASANPSFLGLIIAGGQSVLGGLAGAYLGAVLTKRLIGYRAGTGDLFAPAVALGIGIGRFGCLLTETPGVPTGGSWGVVIDTARAAQIPFLIEFVRGNPVVWHDLTRSQLFLIPSMLLLTVAFVRRRRPVTLPEVLDA